MYTHHVDKSFIQRYRAITRKHRRLAAGYVTTFCKRTGLLEHQPRGELRRLSAMPLAILIGSFLAFKIFLYTRLGPETYAQHIEALQAGNFSERVGAVLMWVDPASARISDLAQRVF